MLNRIYYNYTCVFAAAAVETVNVTPLCGSASAQSPPPPPFAILSPPPPPPTGTPLPPTTAPVTLQIGSVDATGNIVVNFQSSQLIAGYQFNVVHDFTEEPIILSGMFHRGFSARLYCY